MGKSAASFLLLTLFFLPACLMDGMQPLVLVQELTITSQSPGSFHEVGRAIGKAWEVDAEVDSAGLLTQSAPVSVKKGIEYKAIFEFKLTKPLVAGNSAEILTLEAYSPNDRTILASRTLKRSDFKATLQPQEFLLSFSNPLGSPHLNFRVFWFKNFSVQHLRTHLILSNTETQVLMPAESDCHEIGHATRARGWEMTSMARSGAILTCEPIAPSTSRGLKLVTVTLYTFENPHFSNEKQFDTALVFSVVDRTSHSILTKKPIAFNNLRPLHESQFSLHFFYPSLPGHDIIYSVTMEQPVPVEHRMTTLQSLS